MKLSKIQLKKAKKLLNDLPAQNKFRKYFSKAIFEHSRNNKKKTEKYAAKSVKNVFDNMILLWQTGNHYKESNNLKEAEKYYSAVCNINPFERVSLFEKMFCLKDLGKKKEALETLDNYIRINPSDRRIVNYRPKFVKILEG